MNQDFLGNLKKFCEKEIAPFAAEDDRLSRFRLEVFTGLGELGVTAMVGSEEYEGMNLPYQDFCESLREIARHSVAHAVTVSVSSMIISILEKYGSPEHQKKFLPKLNQGTMIGAFALTEPGAGSDAGSLTTKAQETEQGFILNGSKMFITSGGIAGVYIVMARTGLEGGKGVSAFVVEAGTKGFTVGKKEHKMGWKASPTTELIFDQCLIPKANLIGGLGEGFNVAKRTLEKGRISIAAISLGLAEQAMHEAMKYISLRKQFGKKLFDHQGLEFLVAHIMTEIKASEMLVKAAAQSFDEGSGDPMLASMAKLKATDVCMMATTEAVQLLGGVGYTEEFPLERYMRDAKVLQIVEGTNQIQKIIIARELKKKYS